MRRWSWLGVIRAVLSAAIVLDLVGLVVGVLQLSHGAYPVGAVPPGGLGPLSVPGGVAGTVQVGDLTLLGHPVGAFQLVTFGLSHGLGAAVVALPMLVYAHHVTEVARREDPFSPAMVGRLRRLGAVVLLGGLVSTVAAYVAGRALLDDLLTGDPALRAVATVDGGAYPSLWWLLPGLLLLAFAEVVRRGCALRAELDEVI